MKADSAVILLSVAALFLLGVLGFVITGSETEDQVVPGSDPDNPEYMQVTSEIRPFFKVGISSIIFGLIILLIFALIAGASRLRRT
jgi:hypothetical protein